MGNVFFFTWEAELIEFLQASLPNWLMSIISGFSFFGEELVLLGILGFFYWCRDKDAGKYLGEIAVMGILWNTMVKNVFCRRRPYMDNEKINLLRPLEKDADLYDAAAQGFSFPSGHSTNAAAVYGALARFRNRRPARILAGTLMLAVGFSRVAVGAHFPTDVLFGWGMGLFIAFFLPWLKRRLQNENLFCALLVLSALPGLLYCRSEDYYTALGLLVGFVLAMKFEERYVRFENTRDPLAVFLRLFFGGLIYLVCNLLLKRLLPAGFLMRTLRYALLAFLLLGLYPLTFKLRGKNSGKCV